MLEKSPPKNMISELDEQKADKEIESSSYILTSPY